MSSSSAASSSLLNVKGKLEIVITKPGSDMKEKINIWEPQMNGIYHHILNKIIEMYNLQQSRHNFHLSYTKTDSTRVICSCDDDIAEEYNERFDKKLKLDLVISPKSPTVESGSELASHETVPIPTEVVMIETRTPPLSPRSAPVTVKLEAVSAPRIMPTAQRSISSRPSPPKPVPIPSHSAAATATTPAPTRRRERGGDGEGSITSESASVSSTQDLIYQRNLSRLCSQLLEKLINQPRAYDYFYTPVDPIALGIPDYFTVIKRPMALETIENKLSCGDYSTPEEFAADVRLVFTNAMTYNRAPTHPVHEAARDLLAVFEEKYRLMVYEHPRLIGKTAFTDDATITTILEPVSKMPRHEGSGSSSSGHRKRRSPLNQQSPRQPLPLLSEQAKYWDGEEAEWEEESYRHGSDSGSACDSSSTGGSEGSGSATKRIKTFTSSALSPSAVIKEEKASERATEEAVEALTLLSTQMLGN